MPSHPPLPEYREFFNELSPGTLAELVPVELEAWSQAGNCHVNVRQKVLIDGGSQCFGWLITHTFGVIINAVFHSVWMDPGGKLHDLTPHPQERIYSMFLRDPVRTFDFETMSKVPTQFRIVKEYEGDSIITKYIEAHQARFDYLLATQVRGTTNHILDRDTLTMLERDCQIALHEIYQKYGNENHPRPAFDYHQRGPDLKLQFLR